MEQSKKRATANYTPRTNLEHPQSGQGPQPSALTLAWEGAAVSCLHRNLAGCGRLQAAHVPAALAKQRNRAAVQLFTALHANSYSES